MVRYLLGKVLRTVAVLLIVSFATFCLMFGNAEGIARAVLGVNALEADVQREAARLGLDKPLLEQYWSWLGDAVTGDLGGSYFTQQPVTEALSSRVPVTLSLIVCTMILTTIVSVVLGVAAAVRGGWIDRSIQFVSVLGAAVPAYIVAIALIFAFAIQWPIFPATGYIPAADSVSGWTRSLALPVAALFVGSVANAAAQFRGAVQDTMSQDYVRTLRARGLRESHILFRHVLRNASAPGLVVLNLQTLGLLGGVLFVEQIFALPGIGQLSVSSAALGDVPMVMGTVLVTIVFVLIVNVAADLAGAFLNPKARVR